MRIFSELRPVMGDGDAGSHASQQASSSDLPYSARDPATAGTDPA